MAYAGKLMFSFDEVTNKMVLRVLRQTFVSLIFDDSLVKMYQAITLGRIRHFMPVFAWIPYGRDQCKVEQAVVASDKTH